MWAVRREAPGDKLGGGRADQLPARGALGETVRRLLDDGAIELVTGFHTREITKRDGRLELRDGARALLADEVIATTGFRPDLSLLAELRLDLDDRVEAPRDARSADRPQRPLLRVGAAARRRGALPPRRGHLRCRHEELRPRADLPAAHRLRAGPLRRRRPRRRLAGRPQGRASSSPRPACATAASPPAPRSPPPARRAAAPAPRTRRSPPPRERTPAHARAARRPSPPAPLAGLGDRRRAVGHRDRLLGHPLLRLRGLPAPDAARARLLHRPAHRRLLTRAAALRRRRPRRRSLPRRP